jgi:enamine deaminase RidA (YjgF/YER057c/UK114 family)
MARKRITSGSRFEELAAYSRAVVDGEWVFVSGTTGYDFETGAISEDVGEQTEQCLRNIEAALREAESSMADVVRVRCFLTDRSYIEPMAAALRRWLGDVRPANTTVICDLAAPEMKVEIEVTALRRRG